MSGAFHVTDEAYDDFMGRYSFLLAPGFADFARVAAGMHVLDVGAGTGALTRELVRRGAHVAAADPSPEFTQSLRARFPEVDVREAPAERLPFADDAFDVALAQLVVSFMTDAPAGVRELRRVARTVALCMWGRDTVEMFAALDRTQHAVAPGSPERGAQRYRTAEELRALLEDAGFDGVEDGTVDVTAEYGAYDELWRSLVGGVGPAGEWVLSLDDERREQTRTELHRQLGRPEGAFALSGRAYVVRGTRA